MQSARIGNIEGEFLVVDIGRVDEAMSVNLHHTDTHYEKLLWIAVYAAVRNKESNNTNEQKNGFCRRCADFAVAEFAHKYHQMPIPVWKE